MKVVLLGAGRLAGHLGPALIKNGIDIVAVYNRRLDRARKLIINWKSNPLLTDRLEELPNDADLYFLAIADQAIADLAQQLSTHLGANLPLVHTSGATSSAVLQTATHRFGVFYPFQSFSAERSIDFKRIPLCIDASEPELRNQLLACAKKLSKLVYQLDDEQRAQLHVAGVFANNFVNHLIGQSHQLLAKAGISKTILFPLIRETIEKLEQQDAASAQTGPAIRGDENTIKRHLSLLDSDSASKEIYALLTEQIKEKRNSSSHLNKN